MEKAKIKQIAYYLKELEEGLYEWDYRYLDRGQYNLLGGLGYSFRRPY